MTTFGLRPVAWDNTVAISQPNSGLARNPAGDRVVALWGLGGAIGFPSYRSPRVTLHNAAAVLLDNVTGIAPNIGEQSFGFGLVAAGDLDRYVYLEIANGDSFLFTITGFRPFSLAGDAINWLSADTAWDPPNAPSYTPGCARSRGNYGACWVDASTLALFSVATEAHSPQVEHDIYLWASRWTIAGGTATMIDQTSTLLGHRYGAFNLLPMWLGGDVYLTGEIVASGVTSNQFATSERWECVYSAGALGAVTNLGAAAAAGFAPNGTLGQGSARLALGGSGKTDVSSLRPTTGGTFTDELLRIADAGGVATEYGGVRPYSGDVVSGGPANTVALLDSRTADGFHAYRIVDTSRAGHSLVPVPSDGFTLPSAALRVDRDVTDPLIVRARPDGNPGHLVWYGDPYPLVSNWSLS